MLDNGSVRSVVLVIAAAAAISACSDPVVFVAEPDDTTPPPEFAIESTQPPLSPDTLVTVPAPLTEDGVGYLISMYLPDNIIEPELGGEVFCGYEMYGWEQTDDVAVAWLWTYCGEYYMAQSDLALGTAGSAPVAIHLAETSSGWMVSFAEQAEVLSSVLEMFPPEHAERALSSNKTTRNLPAEVEHAARSQLAS